MNDKKRKFMVRLVCFVLAGMMVIGGLVAAISYILAY